jgi:putative spermidine/putrescine transport system permease protein
MKRSSKPALGRILMAAYLAAFFVYLESPLVVVVLASFNDGPSVTFPPDSLSLHWYAVLWDLVREAPDVKPGLVESIWTSIWLGIVSTLGATIAGVLAAFGLQRYRFPGRNLMQQCFLLPLLFPQVVTGVGLVLWFSQIGGVPTWLRLVVGHLILTMPYVVVTTTASLETLDIRLEEAAMNLGAGRLATFFRITLPGIRSGVVSGAVFAWLVSFSNFTVTFFLFSGEVKPLPPWLYEIIQYFIDPSIAALSTFVLLITFAVLLTVNRMFALGRLMGLRQ